MKRLAFIWLLVFAGCCSLVSFSQPYGHEWINYSQQYYKIPITQTGIYRIDSTTLSNAGIPIGGINPRNIQLFIKGEEQYIYIKGEGDNVLNTSDYIEFYAERNNCSFDSLAYNNLSFIPNPYAAIFNDTNTVFLTWNTSTNNRRMTPETDINFNGYTAPAYFYTEKITATKSSYNVGRYNIPDVTDPRYIEGEGYGENLAMGSSTGTGTGINIYTGASLPTYFATVVSGGSISNLGTYDHEVKVQYYDASNNLVQLIDTFFYGYASFKLNYTINTNQLGTGSGVYVTSVNNPAFSSFTNQTMVHYTYFKYPKIASNVFDSQAYLYIDDNIAASKTLLDLGNVNTGSGNVLFYDITNHKYISTVVSGSNVKLLIPNSSSTKKCYLFAENGVMKVNQLKPVNQNGYFVNYRQQAGDSAFIIITHGSLLNGAGQYKSYRESVAGGSHHVIMANVEDLYDQYAYGNRKNPLAIKQLCRFLTDSMPTEPQYLLLIGKSIQISELDPSNWENNLVPTMGFPASDNILCSGYKNTSTAFPYIATGRLAAKNDQDISNYLNKVMQHETNGVAPWQKRVLHFAGGTDANQQSLFQIYLQGYEQTIEDTSFGGYVYTFKKTSTAPVQITISDSVKKLIDSGTGLITFFGHGSYTGFDQAIDDPAVYNNVSKYPMMIANSCYSGNIHTAGVVSSSERFVLIDQKGSIGFLASTVVGLVYTLNNFTHEYYKAIGQTHYGLGIGVASKRACYVNSFSLDPLQHITSLEMTLHGDPSVVIPGSQRLPDYEITNSSVSFDTHTYVDSIGINVRIANLGKAVNDTFIVRIDRLFPNLDTLTLLKQIKAPFYQDTLQVFIPVDYESGVGLNYFRVQVDCYNAVNELNENNNNTLGNIPLLIQGGDIVPSYPYKYAIIPHTPQVTLRASTAYPFSPMTSYRFQIDTTDAFTNPINSTLIQSTGGVVDWTVSLPFPDSTVFYWRVSKDSVSPANGFNWRESSFQVIGTKTGWAQAHFFQFKNDTYQYVKYKKPQRLFSFANDVTSISATTGFLPYIAWDNISYTYNTSVMATWNCAWDGWTIVAFDSISGKPWPSVSLSPPNAAPGPYGNCHCDGTRPLYAFDYGASNYCGFPNTWQDSLLQFLNNVPVNTRILAYSAQYYQPSTYSNALYAAFESFGSGNIRTVKDTTAMIIYGRKGMSIGQAHEVIAPNTATNITLTDSVQSNWTSGYILSEIIGPSSKWNSLHWRQMPMELPNADSVVLKVIGIKANGLRDTLVVFPADSIDVLDLPNYADAATYPYLQLMAMMSDKIYHTPPQMKRWQVIYDQAPECAINANKGLTVVNDTVQEGDNLVVRIPIENIGQVAFADSLVISYWVENEQNVKTTLPEKLKAKPFVPGQVIMDTVVFNTLQHAGNNTFWMDVNPLGHVRYQSEQYHFNNVLTIPFYVNSDHVNPLLDVTFDGVHILNNDIVSAKPYVLITLKDENKFLALNDTSDFNIFLKRPSDVQEKPLYFSSPLLKFTSALLPNNSCKIEYQPDLPEDGIYSLVVQAKDRSDNNSGSVDYKIQFEVINKSTITEVMNYPNPFSTSTRFVFTLTGSEIPDMFTIQIMTITGKVVKEISKDQLGPIRVGRNISQYAWDGRDDYGDRLGNGVYLYRVITRNNGSSVEKRSTDADQYFKKGFGKMVIMR